MQIHLVCDLNVFQRLQNNRIAPIPTVHVVAQWCQMNARLKKKKNPTVHNLQSRTLQSELAQACKDCIFISADKHGLSVTQWLCNASGKQLWNWKTLAIIPDIGWLRENFPGLCSCPSRLTSYLLRDSYNETFYCNHTSRVKTSVLTADVNSELFTTPLWHNRRIYVHI